MWHNYSLLGSLSEILLLLQQLQPASLPQSNVKGISPSVRVCGPKASGQLTKQGLQ